MTTLKGTSPKKYSTLADILADISLHAEIAHYNYPKGCKKDPWGGCVSFKMNGKVRTVVVRRRLKRDLIPALLSQINYRISRISTDS